jgi:hypothetical protein
MYAQQLEGDSWLGERMDVGKIEKMSGRQFNYLRGGVQEADAFKDQQLGQMYELMQAIRKRQLEYSESEQ